MKKAADVRDQRIETLIGALDRALFERLPRDTAEWPIMRGVFDALQKPLPAKVKPGLRPLRAPDIMATALDLSRQNAADLVPVANAFADLIPDLDWWNRMAPADDPRDFIDGHAFIVGPGGLEDRDDAEIGVSLLAPDVVYPDHHHPPPEVYLSMSAGAWRKNRGPWVEPGIGGTIYNESNAVHAMKSDDEPLFAFWILLLK